MNSSPVFLSFFLLISSAAAFNITRLLDQHPDFSTFNSLLSQTKLAAQINSRQTITILAVDNGAVSSISGSPLDVQKHILSVHVVLDYYDMEKLHKLSKKSALLTTLFQSSGLASNQQGFINVTVEKSSGQVKMGSAVPGSQLNANVVKQVDSKPYNISVIQVSTLIIPTGIDSLNVTDVKHDKAPTASPKAAPAPADAPSEAPASESEAPASDAPTSAAPTSDAPTSDAPTSDAPASDAPASDSSPADTPAADGPASDLPSDSPVAADGGPTPADGPSESGASAALVALGTCIGVVMGAVCMSAL